MHWSLSELAYSLSLSNSHVLLILFSFGKFQIGSTEWVEENRAMLTSRTVAYLNVDSAVYGRGFYASATPQLDELLKEASKQVYCLKEI
jgi:Iap family predicted aminopeptidase